MKGKEINFWDFLRPEKFRYIASILLAVLGVFCGLIPYFSAYRLLLCLADGTCGTGGVVFYVLVAAAAFLLQIVFHSLSTAISHVTAFSILERLRIAITKRMIKMPLGYTQAKGSGYFKYLLIDEIERLEFPLAHAIPETTSGVFLPIAIVVFLFSVDWRMGLAASVPAVAVLLYFFPSYMKIMNRFAGTYYGSLDKMNGKVIEYIRGIKEIKIFGRAQDAYSKYEQSISHYRDSTLRLYNKMYFVSAPALVVLSSILVSVLGVGGLLYSRGELSFSVFLLSIIISIGVGAPLLKFMEFMDNFFHIKNGKRLVDEVMSSPELPQTKAARANVYGHRIELKDVSFAYDEADVLDGVSIVFRENQKTALVGPSGSGKTTIANLIARFWDVDGGSIKLGGVEYRDIPLPQLMEHINYVTQEPFLFNMSIRENIRVGRPEATDSEVEAAAAAAQCAEFIDKLEHGYDTVAGDAGAKLSGGQRQRLIIARAILRDAPVLILDEATAYTDMENQQKLQASLDALCKDKTLIVIAHRLSTVADCDQIIVMENGKVSACGTHESLLESSGAYRKMWDITMASASWSAGREAKPC